MASPAQIAANRINAQASTGPRTAGGKARSRRNALKHGLYARDVTLPGEDMEAYRDVGAEFEAEFEPEGAFEEALVRRLADIWWRMGRLGAIEAGVLEPERDLSFGPGPAEAETDDLLASAPGAAFEETATLDRLGRYEARLERAFTTGVQRLEDRQARRRLRAIRRHAGA